MMSEYMANIRVQTGSALHAERVRQWVDYQRNRRDGQRRHYRKPSLIAAVTSLLTGPRN